MKRAVIILGALSLLAMFMAQTASAALVMFPPFWPLLLAPSAFLYLGTIWGVSAVLPIRQVWLARGAALVIVVGAASLAVLPLRLAAIADFEKQAKVKDIIPAAPIVLSGDVRIETDWDDPDGPRPCDDLCLALLDLDGVTSVTMAGPSQATAYRLVPAEAADPAAVVTPSYPGGFIEWGGSGGDSGKVDAYWEARLAGPERLVRSPPPDRADYTLDPGTPKILHGNKVIARWVNVYRRVPIIPPLIGMEFSGADTGFAAGPLTLAYELREAGPFRGSHNPYAFFGQVLALKNYDGLPDPPSDPAEDDQSPDQSFASRP